MAWNERRGDGNLWRIALAGGLAGLAVTTEYPLLIAAAIVGLYVLARSGATLRDPARRAVAYAAGALAGVAPLLLYNAWAFSNPLHMSYADAVSQPGLTGHDTLGLNSGGVFGITAPRLHDGLSLLVGGRGLLTLTPVLVVAIAGVVADAPRAATRPRRGRSARSRSPTSSTTPATGCRSAAARPARAS